MSTSRPEPALRLPPPIRATAADLPAPVAAALADPPSPGELTVDAAGLQWFARAWGAEGDPPLLLVHGVTSSSTTWWRVGPALAAAGYRVVAPDQAGHGATERWTGHVRFRDNAADLAAFVRAAGIARPDLRVVGHSWGAMTVAALPAVGIVPSVLVLLDPPAIPRDTIARLLDDPVERRYGDVVEAEQAIRLANPTWSAGDVRAKAEGLTTFDEPAVRSILLGNDWDGGLADLADPAAREVAVWLVRGEPGAGSYVLPSALPELARRVRPDRLLTVADGPHSPQRTHPAATLVALLRALTAPA